MDMPSINLTLTGANIAAMREADTALSRLERRFESGTDHHYGAFVYPA